MNQLQVIALAGLLFAGKSTLAKLLEPELKLARFDINDIRLWLFPYDAIDSEKDRGLDELQVRASWKSLYALTDSVLEAQKSVILAATFSRASYRQELFKIAAKHDALVKFIYCWAPDEVIISRVEDRIRESNDPLNPRSAAAYFRVKARYEKIIAPDLLELDTSQSPQTCLAKIMEYVHC